MFRQVVGTILRLADRYADHWLPITGSHDVPAYGFERIIDPPPLEVNTLRLLSEFHAGSLTLADTWRHDARARRRSRPSWSWPPRPGSSATRRGPSSGIGGDVASTTATTLEMAEAVSAFHFPDDLWARVIYDLVVGRGAIRRVHGSVARDAGRGARADLLRARRQLRHREPQRDRPSRPRSASSARRASSSCSSRTSSSAGTAEAAPDDEPAPPLPARILIPVANPMTAEELIRLGAAMLDPQARRARRRSASSRSPRGCRCPRARPARATPAGCSSGCSTTPRTGRRSTRSCASAGTPPRASSRPRPSRKRTSSSSAGAASAPPAATGRQRRPTVFSPTIDEVVRDSPCDIAVVKQRGSKRDQARPRPGPRRPARRAGDPLRRRDRALPRRDGRRPPPRAAGHHPRGPGPGGAGARRVRQAAPPRPRRGRPARGAERPQRDPARGREGRPRGHGRVGVHRAARTARRHLFGALPEAIAARAKPSVVVVKTRETIERARPSSSWPPAPRPWPPPTVPPRRPAPSRPASSAGSASRTSTTPSSPTCAGSCTLKEKQG